MLEIATALGGLLAALSAIPTLVRETQSGVRHLKGWWHSELRWRARKMRWKIKRLFRSLR
jgi:hypothetical protein